MSRLPRIQFCARHAMPVWTMVGVASAMGLATGSAFAIPSPELIVGSFTSISQLIALSSALIGGSAAVVTVRARGIGGGEPVRWLIGVMAAAVVLLIASVGFNIYQYVDRGNERQALLEDTLLRPAKAPGGSANDPDQKELTFPEQLRHPMRISTDEAAQLLEATSRGERDDLIFLDVREAAEQEMGTLRGVTFVRFPDLPAAKIDFTGKKAILFCHNGNRSSETCEALARQGIDCRFIVGGLEKWVVEKRAMEGLAVRSLDLLRAIPDYPNHHTLLDTPTVRRLIGEQKAIFVDIRYPTDFAEQHLPGAVNLSLRRMPTPELHARIAQLPRVPLILPCYDRRGCFFAEVLGYELSRAGHDVRGRYTLPWTYFVPRGRPPHVQKWIEENNRSIWVKSARYVADVLAWASQWTGLVLAIILLAFLSRLLVLPFSVKAERDQIRSRAAAGELDSIKRRLKDDPARRARAIRAVYDRLGLTPIRNLIALLFLPVMAVAMIAVQDVAARNGGQFLWLGSIAEPDPWLILPLAFGALLALYLDRAFARATWQRVVIWAVALPLLTAVAALFSAGADIYLVASAALLLLQRLAVAGHATHLAALWRRWRLGPDVISLDEPTLLPNHGNKAYRLAEMRAQGLPVPQGVLLTPRFLDNLAFASERRRKADLDRIWRWLGSERVAVRSSANGEDNEHQSFAGVFESVPDVDRAGLDAAIAKVQSSFTTDRANGYGSAGHGSILVQRMVAAEYSGVLFTRDPAAGGLAMIELVRGTAENLVSGAVRPATYRLGRVSGETIDQAQPPIDLRPLQALGRRAEQLFGAAQDVEWTYRGGRFFVVQSRTITRTMPTASDDALAGAELARALDLADGLKPHETAFTKSELCEMLPQPTPLSLSLMESLWETNGSVDLAAQALGLSYQTSETSAPYLVTILGRLYVNMREERARLLKAGQASTRLLLRRADRIEDNFRTSFLPRFLAEIRVVEAADFDKLSTAELFEAFARLHEKFVRETHVEVDIINIAANFYLERARRELSAQGLDPLVFIGPATSAVEAIASLPDRRLALARMAHRAVLDYELAEPRYGENPSAFRPIPEITSTASAQRVDVDTGRLSKRLRGLVDVVRRFQALKEDAKHYSLRELAVLRRVVLTLDRRLGLNGLSFFLSFDELLSLRERPMADLRETAEGRRHQRARFLAMAPLAPTLTVRELETISAGGDAAHRDSEGVIRGTRVAGSDDAEGRARVIADEDAERGRPIPDFQDGDIIVATMVHPAWLPYFRRAGGFVCQVGGWLSHTAILAREYDVPLIVNTHGMSAITDGSILRLRSDGTVEMLERERALDQIAA